MNKYELVVHKEDDLFPEWEIEENSMDECFSRVREDYGKGTFGCESEISAVYSEEYAVGSVDNEIIFEIRRVDEFKPRASAEVNEELTSNMPRFDPDDEPLII